MRDISDLFCGSAWAASHLDWLFVVVQKIAFLSVVLSCKSVYNGREKEIITRG